MTNSTSGADFTAVLVLISSACGQGVDKVAVDCAGYTKVRGSCVDDCFAGAILANIQDLASNPDFCDLDLPVSHLCIRNRNPLQWSECPLRVVSTKCDFALLPRSCPVAEKHTKLVSSTCSSSRDAIEEAELRTHCKAVQG